MRIENSLLACLDYQEQIYSESPWCDYLDGLNFGNSVAIGDYNGDGLGDLIVNTHHPTPWNSAATGLFMYYNDNGFWEAEYIDYQVDDVVAADLNNDGLSDIVTLDDTGYVQVFYGGSDNFISAWNGDCDLESSFFMLSNEGDMNGDGIEDVLIFDSWRAWAVYGFDINLFPGGSPRGPTPIVYPFRRPVYTARDEHLHKAGDVNGDGGVDYIGGLVTGSVGRAFVRLGPLGTYLNTWGYNGLGQLGDGTTTSRFTPGQIGLGAEWTAISGGYYHTVALKSDGSLWSWGQNNYGQLGDGTTIERHEPVRIGTGENWTAVSAGDNYTIAIQNDGTIWGWGYNVDGSLGDGTTMDWHAPVQIGAGTANWADVSAGGCTLALKTDGSLWAWGSNTYGCLGDGTTSRRLLPVPIGSDTDWAAVSTKRGHTVAVKTDGSLWAWGYNETGCLGDGTTINRNAPVPIGSDTDWVAVSSGRFHTVALKRDGSLWTWGSNLYGELGDGTTTEHHVPFKVGSDTDWAAVSGGTHCTLALKSNCTLYAWGANLAGQLGDGTTTTRMAPVQIGLGMDWAALANGYLHTIALKAGEYGATDNWSIEGIGTGVSPLFGNIVGSGGDINGDGYGDVVVTDPNHDGQPGNPGHLGYWGRVYVWYGGPPSPGDPTGLGLNETPQTADIRIDGDYASGSGRSYAIGDINGDGITDLGIGENRRAQQCEWPTGGFDIVEAGGVKYYLSTCSNLCAGDLNEDGDVDGHDLFLLITNPGQLGVAAFTADFGRTDCTILTQ